jgi:hypothetical protein
MGVFVTQDLIRTSTELLDLMRASIELIRALIGLMHASVEIIKCSQFSTDKK